MAIPSKKSASKKAAPAPASAGKKAKKPLFALGDHAMFTGYTSLEDGDDEIIVRPNVLVVIESEPVLDENGKFKYAASVLSTDEDDLDENGDLPADTLFEDELAELTEDQEAEAAEIAEAIESANDEDPLLLHGRAADEDETSKEGKAGVKALKAEAKEQGLDPDDYDTWEALADALLNPELKAQEDPLDEGKEDEDALVQVTQEEMDELVADAEEADEDNETPEGKKADKRLTAFFKKHDVAVEDAGSWAEAIEDNVEVADEEEAPKAKAKKAAAAPKAKKEDAEEAPLVLTATVKKALKSGDAHAAAIEIKARGDQAYFDLACILTHIRKNKLHTSMKDDDGVAYEDTKEGFGAYVEQQFQMALPTAYHWMRIYAAVSALGKGGADLAGIGWDKAIYIALAIKSTGFDMEDDEFTALMEFAVANDRKTLANHVRVDYIDVAADGEDGGGDSKAKRLAKQKEKKVTRRFVVFGDQANSIIDEAISAAKEAIGTDDDSLGLVQVCTEWAQLQDMDIPVEQAIEALEGRYGIKLVVETPAAPAKGKAKQAAPAKKVVTRKK